MSQKGQNGNILNFFRPLPTQSPRASQTSAARPSPLPPPPSSSPVPSQRNTPVKPAGRRLEIGASDDDDGSSSDDSLEDLSTLIGRSRPSNPVPTSAKPLNDPYATPRAKRTAVAFYASPLAFMPKHKFDMKALAKDALQDDATNLSSLRVKAAQESDDEELPFEKGEAFVDIVKDNGGPDAKKVLRAVQRAEPGQAELRYCFFDQNYKVPASSPAPKKARTGPWRLLTEGDVTTREQHLVSGLPHMILSKTGGLPDELFQWILDELCVQKSFVMRQEYYNLIATCPEQVEHLLTPERLEDLFIRLGATEELKDKSVELAVSSSDDVPYQGRDWACLQSFLILLGLIATHLSLSSVTYATQTLLRMSMDRALICSIDTLAEYEYTIQRLVEAVPMPSWASFVSDQHES